MLKQWRVLQKDILTHFKYWDILYTKMLNLPLYGINPYRKRLIDRGIIDGNTRGYLKFTLPLFKEFVIDREDIFI